MIKKIMNIGICFHQHPLQVYNKGENKLTFGVKGGIAMLEKKIFANGQQLYDLKGDYLTYYFKNGAIKAEGRYVKNHKEGEWKYYRKDGHLWKINTYQQGKKHGPCQRYSPEGQVETDELFEQGVRIKSR